MSALAPLRIDAMVGRAEHPAMLAAAEQLSEHLGAGTGKGWPIALHVTDPSAADAGSPTPTAAFVVTSLLEEVARIDEVIEVVAERWRDRLRSLTEGDGSAAHRVFVCTVFRYVAGNDGIGGTAPPPEGVTERIRRLNLMAAELSCDTGIGVIDIDRVAGLVGAHALRSDYRMTGPIAAEVAGHVIVAGLLAAGLDAFVPLDVEDRARAAHGGLSNLAKVVERRLARRRDGGSSRG